MSKFNFDDANSLRTLAASKGVGSKEWIEFANMMFDRFPEIYDTAKGLNDRYMQSLEADKDAEALYLFQRKGVTGWATCDHERYLELSCHASFNTKALKVIEQHGQNPMLRSASWSRS